MAVEEVKTRMPSSTEHGGSEGVVLPIGLSTERESNPKQGTTRGNSSTKELEVYIGNAWISYEPKTEVVSNIVSSFTARSPTINFIDTTIRVVTATLPSSAGLGERIVFVDKKSNWKNRHFGVKGQSGVKVDGSTATKYFNADNTTVTFTFTGNDGWVSDLPEYGTPTTFIGNDNWPVSALVNENYFFALNAANENQVTLAQGKVGDRVKLVSTTKVLFSQVPVIIKTASADKVEGVDTYTLNKDAWVVEFEHTGSGWIITSAVEEYHKLHPKTITSGSFNLLTANGSTKLAGNVNSYTYLPEELSDKGTMDAILHNEITDELIVQELTYVESLTAQTPTRRFLRTGRKIGDNYTFPSEWIELFGVLEGTRKVFTGRANIFQDLAAGEYYMVNPQLGTPDHSSGNLYLVKVISSNNARSDTQTRHGTRFISAYNMNTNQWWESGASSISSIRGWRKVNANTVIMLNDGDTVTHTINSSETNVVVDSTGRQTITINTPSSVASLGSTKIGDIVNIQNLKIGVIQTVVNTGVDLYDTEGVNLGKGPHTMTGKGALRFVVATTNGSTVFFKILYGVKVK